jgi:hypothetical protein
MACKQRDSANRSRFNSELYDPGPQVPREGPLDSGDTSGPCRTIVHLSIRPHVMREQKVDNVYS